MELSPGERPDYLLEITIREIRDLAEAEARWTEGA